MAVQLELNKTYQNTMSHPVKIIEVRNRILFIGNNMCTYNAEGKVISSGRAMKDHKQNIILKEI